MKKEACAVCKQSFPLNNLIGGSLITQSVLDKLKEKYPSFSDESFICLKDLNHIRTDYLETLIKRDIGEVEDLEKEVLTSLRNHELLSEDTNKSFEESLSFPEKMSDGLATFGGSWKFIILFSSILIGWIIFNSIKIINNHFDPYPFILLNLVLSCLAAIQAPIIMMSQNRQEAKDRLRADMDYKINLKAELEIRHLKTKLDQLASHQWHRLLEIQTLQTEMLEELSERVESIKTKS